MNAKIADFGFSVEKPKISQSGRTVITVCFIACGTFTDRSDVYRFGVVSNAVELTCYAGPLVNVHNHTTFC